ncbi:hemagglutinin repeat-containing protein, partial [Polaromonas sp.]|uniref:hemagglutinin repeat-containing protein n=1 Tax=Polaromonas sp. TaxID=1869339 RepID=UPI002FC8B728
SLATASYAEGGGFLSSASTELRNSDAFTQAVGSQLGGRSVSIASGKDLSVQGSSVISDQQTSLLAGNNITIEAAQNTQAGSSFKESKSSGLSLGDGMSVSYGKQQQSLEQQNQSTTAAASTVASIGGHVTLVAGNQYQQVGSDVLAPGGDITIAAKNVEIVEARETSRTDIEQKSKQSGITVGLSNPVLSALQTGQQMVEAASQTRDARMQALAAASAALKGYNTYKDLSTNGKFDPAKAAEINLTVSLGSSQSESKSSQNSNSAAASTVAAGHNVTIVASRTAGASTDSGQDSNLTVQGASISAGHNATLLADNQIKLLASQSSASLSSSSIGASVGTNPGVTLSASKGRGHADGADTSYTNTRVSAGNTASLISGGDTKLIGAVVAANTVQADVGGNLNIESPQDSSSYTSRQSSSGGSITISPAGVPTGGGISASKSNIDSNYRSVNQQSGLKAGDGGFQVSVNGSTDLKGSVIASTDKAVNDQKNSFQTGGALTISDIQNTASYQGSAAGISLDVGQQAGKFGVSGVGVGVGSDKGHAGSTTSSGISGMAGNTAVRSADAETGIKPIFDADKVQKEINAQVQIMQAFTKEAPKAASTFAAGQAAELRKQGQEEEAKKWDEGGVYRIALHTAAGALSGGASGAAGAAASASAAPLLNELQDGIQQGLQTAGLSPEVAKGIAQSVAGLTAAGVGAAVGGVQGAATALTVDVNNRQLHPTEIKWIKDNAKRFAQQQNISEADAEKRLAQQAFREVQFGAEGQTDGSAQAFLKSAGNQLLPGDPNIPGQTMGYMFKADPVQKASPNMYANTVVKDPEALAFYGKNGITQPTAAQIQAAVIKDAAARNTLTNATLGVAGLAVVATLPPALSWCLTNPVACNRIVIAGGEIAAGDALGPTSLAVLGTASAVKAVRSADEVNAAMKARGWEPAWSPGTPVITTELKPGTKVQMVVTEADYAKYKNDPTIPPIGGWATFDDVASQVAARQDMALLKQFKPDVKYVIEYEVVKPIAADIGFVGKQTEPSGQLLRGGGTQAAFDWKDGMNRSDYLRMVGVPKQLPALSK